MIPVALHARLAASGYSAVPARTEDAAFVFSNLRERDREEAEILERISGGRRCAERLFYESFLRSRVCLAFMHHGRVLALGGIGPTADGKAECPWFAGHKELEKHKRLPILLAPCAALIFPPENGKICNVMWAGGKDGEGARRLLERAGFYLAPLFPDAADEKRHVWSFHNFF